MDTQYSPNQNAQLGLVVQASEPAFMRPANNKGQSAVASNAMVGTRDMAAILVSAAEKELMAAINRATTVRNQAQKDYTAAANKLQAMPQEIAETDSRQFGITFGNSTITFNQKSRVVTVGADGWKPGRNLGYTISIQVETHAAGWQVSGLAVSRNVVLDQANSLLEPLVEQYRLTEKLCLALEDAQNQVGYYLSQKANIATVERQATAAIAAANLAASGDQDTIDRIQTLVDGGSFRDVLGLPAPSSN